MNRLLCVGAIAVFCVLGCAPRSSLMRASTLDSRPTLSFRNAPENAIVFIDGLNMGNAARYNGRSAVLSVEPGTHEIVIMENNARIMEQTIFVESEHKEIHVR